MKICLDVKFIDKTKVNIMGSEVIILKFNNMISIEFNKIMPHNLCWMSLELFQVNF